ncbi:flagellar assembly peptidoglycan hydrolase FlgJ [Alteromonas sp. a30]|uniref:flagellar assembly peptidoglycan hydrolase FlgJ n=1 Tax=Alteromonas sp. a30 TaxID=2730917 RepID=UPI002282DEA9|nr:flagellar assembly peptidoglycan hydrolase FlgJ [Alteromonas sp. a30]MCY7294544.1 flagellar assembly peptidoglycan hydrolase FlgJ [Alteromonas sp. a30]
MDISSQIQTQIDQAQSAYDFSGLDNLRRGAQKGDSSALEKTAKQFEGIFIHMMLKSMRAAEDVLADDSNPLNSSQVKFYRDMHDQQLATNMAETGSMGLAELIVQQLDPKGSGVMPAGLVRSGANLEDIVRAAGSSQSSGLGDAKASNAEASSSDKAEKRAAFQSPLDFVRSLLPVAEKVAGEIGVEPKALVAQAAVETGWGKYMIHSGKGENSHNLFGIKADRNWNGNKEVVETLEYAQGVPQKQKAAFRAYGDFHESMQDYVKFIKESPRYRGAVEQSANPEAYFKQLQQAGYATDPAYADKVMSVMKSDTLSSISSALSGL